MTPKVILVMIVRDEAPILSYRLRCLLGEIDAYAVVDTGSVDETQGIVVDVLKFEGKLPGVLASREWAGFADARTAAVAEAQQWVDEEAQRWGDEEPGDGNDWWALLLDADTVAWLEPGWRKCLVGDVVECAVHHDALRYRHPRLLRLNGHRWRWRGVVHEYLEVPGSMRVSHTDLLRVEHGHGGARERKGNAVKYREDAELILKTRAANEEPDLDARYAFYLAQSWKDCGEVDLAIVHYMERARMGGWLQEVYMAWLRAGELLWEPKQNWAAAEACWVAAWSTDPTRAEAIIGLASLARVREFWVPALTFGRIAQTAAKAGVHGLFADVNVLWRSEYEIAIAGSWVGTPEAKKAGRRACLALINGPYAPDHIKVAMQDALERFYPVPKRGTGRVDRKGS